MSEERELTLPGEAIQMVGRSVNLLSLGRTVETGEYWDNDDGKIQCDVQKRMMYRRRMMKRRRWGRRSPEWGRKEDAEEGRAG
jgi:hypothetical protein